MNIFRDLVAELKEENLLEETVIEANSQEQETEKPKAEYLDADSDNEASDTKQSDAAPVESVKAGSMREKDQSSHQFEASAHAPSPLNKGEFYRKRAMDEVSGLQMVEHVLSGVEREQMKIVPKPYDDLEVKKVLHRFLQVSDDLNSPEHAQIEFQLMQETESWYSALSHRDKHISVAHLRRFCETTRPVLSSQALISLARFYRNSPYSEAVRSKFDLVLTRLFTKETEDEKRKLTFTREKLIQHLASLYADWSSIPLYAANEDEDSEILITTLKFEDFMAEADAADSFDELIKNDFFNRLRVFKKETSDNFFAPLVTATAIECNVRVGNRYVDLLRKEKEKLSESVLEDKYGFLHDQAISEATGKTLQLVELLKIEKAESAAAVQETPKIEEKETVEIETVKAPAKVKSEKRDGLFAVNKWLLAATVLSIVLSIGMYIWANSFDAPKTSENVKTVNLENAGLKDFLREARINNDTFFGFVLPSWDGLSKENKEEILKKIYSIRNEQGFSKVHLLTNDGRTAGFVTERKLEAF